MRRHEDQQVVGEFLALEALHDLPVGVDSLDIEEGVELDALALEDGRRHLRDRLDGERAPDRRAVVHLRPATDAPFTELRFDEEGHLQRRRWALVRHPGDADDDAATIEGVQCAAKPCGRFGGVEVIRLGREVVDVVRDDPGPRREHQVVIGDPLAVHEMDHPCRLVDRCDLADDEADAGIQQTALRAMELRSSLAPHRDVHEARLVDVLATLVDDRDRHVAGLDASA